MSRCGKIFFPVRRPLTHRWSSTDLGPCGYRGTIWWPMHLGRGETNLLRPLPPLLLTGQIPPPHGRAKPGGPRSQGAEEPVRPRCLQAADGSLSSGGVAAEPRRQRRAESREQRAESGEQRAESREQRAVCRPYFENFSLNIIIDRFGEADFMRPGFLDWRAESGEQRERRALCRWYFIIFHLGRTVNRFGEEGSFQSRLFGL